MSRFPLVVAAALLFVAGRAHAQFPNANPIAPTQLCADSSNRIATTKYVKNCAGGGGPGLTVCAGANVNATDGQDLVWQSSGSNWCNDQRVIGHPGAPSGAGATTTIAGGLGGTGGGNGGPVLVAGGAGDNTGGGNGGDLTLTSGAGGTTGEGLGGNVTIETPAGAVASTSGNISVVTGAADSGSNQNAGTITIEPGLSFNATSTTQLTIASAINSAAGNSTRSVFSYDALGNIALIGANYPSGSAEPGAAVAITAGNGDTVGGGVIIKSGTTANTSGSPGNVSLIGANATTAGPGGAVGLTGGNGAGAAGNGGGIAFNLGAATGTGVTATASIAGGHIQFAGPALSNLSLTSCGSGAAITRTSGASIVMDNDNSGVILAGSGGVTACTIAFTRPYTSIGGGGTANIPACVAMVWSSTPIATGLSAVSATAVTFTFASDISGKKFAFFCPN